MAKKARSRAVPSMTSAEKAALRARNARVMAAVRARPDQGPFAVRTSRGDVQFESITTETVGDEGVECIAIRLRGDVEGGDPNFRIFMPPLLVQDPNGPIQGDIPGRRYREDPVQALAEVVAPRGGRVKGSRVR